MKTKVILLTVALSVISFSKNINDYFNISVGTSFDNPIVRLETVFDPNDNIELGFGLGYEGSKQNIYKITLKDELIDPLFEDRDKGADLIKETIKLGLRGTISSKSSGFEIGTKLLKILYNYQPEVYYTIKSKMNFVIQLGLQYLIENLGTKTVSRTDLTQKEMMLKIMNDEQALKEINDMFVSQRNDAVDDIYSKIDNLNYEDLVSVMPDFIQLQLEKKGIADQFDSGKQRDLLKLDIYNIFNYMDLLKGKPLTEASNFDYEAYMKALETFNKKDISSLMEQSEAVKDFMELVVQKYLPEVKIVKFDLNGFNKLTNIKSLNEITSKLNQFTYSDDDNDKQVFVLNDALIGGKRSELLALKDKTLRDVNAIKDEFAKIKQEKSILKQFSIAKEQFQVSTIGVTSHNISGYGYIKEKLGKGLVKHYFRQELGLMGHYLNPYAKLSTIIGLGYGLEFANRFGIDARIHTIIPVVSEYNNSKTFREASYQLPNIFRFSVNFVIRL